MCFASPSICRCGHATCERPCSHLARPLAQNALTLVFLPYEAYISVDAIVRTLVRMLWTKRRLLEWKTSSDSERGADGESE